MKTKTILLSVACFLGLLSAASLQAEETFKSKAESSKPIAQSRDITIQKVENDYATFSVLVDLDRSDRNYKEGDLLTAHVKSSRDGYLYLVHISSTGKETLLVPNEFQKDNEIKANKAVSYPSPEMSFQFRVTPPFGRETIKAFVTDRKLKSVDMAKFTKAAATALSDSDSKSLADELGSKDILTEAKPSGGHPEFATHEVSYTTYSKSVRSPAASKETRYAVCFGVGKYRDSRIQNLEAAAQDATSIGKLFVRECGVHEDNCAVLTDEKVTRETVRNIFCNVLPELTKPGDVVFVYWSGHGGRMSSTGGGSSSSYTTYLVPFDGMRNDPENTMLLEGPFGQWVQNLNGRKLYFILDSCYSGGLPERAKGFGDEKGATSLRAALGGSKALDDDATEEDIAFRFCFTNFARSKALGQDGLAVLASSTGNQLSWEREDGKLSVMTHYLIEAIKDGPRSMTHKDIKRPVKDAVEKYIRQYRPNAQQTVVEQDDLTPGLVLKP